ncbi:MULTISPECIES: mycofactocin precursor MftA [Streptomyces]|uniref:Mycofactocin MftA n=1 Tax=Streptomyces hirsutus TaxID=35620 RepID=A0ABZ1GES2_9ACTN|nr:mycofactocin precursor MftA [Streptomyces hirsutus]WSD04612.1 mycofactocin precursor MftA [Streptomyces hirsutus]WTD21997.1 mycofactocin precursor MftA [Streptomyces hirsutus]WTD79377.1 mycofactocin precursor MftA [Streptomyces sp. NBC_01635]
MNDLDSSQAQHIHPDGIPSPDELIEADDLIEEISIDGMCGVY